MVKFTVAARAVPRILGKGGVRINEIKAETDAQIDVDKSSEESGVVQITCRGTKKAIASAKALIQEIADQISEETTATVQVDSRFHRTIIGPGGSGLKDLIVRCGGPSDTKAQASLVRLYALYSFSRLPIAHYCIAHGKAKSQTTRSVCGVKALSSRSSKPRSSAWLLSSAIVLCWVLKCPQANIAHSSVVAAGI